MEERSLKTHKILLFSINCIVLGDKCTAQAHLANGTFTLGMQRFEWVSSPWQNAITAGKHQQISNYPNFRNTGGAEISQAL